LIREQTHHRLTLGNALDCFCNQRCHRELANFLASQGAVGQRDGIGHHDFVEGIAFGNAVDRRARKNRVRAIGLNLLGAAFFQHFSRFEQRAGGVDHVVHDDAVAAINVTYHVHDFRHIGLRTALVNDGHVAA